MFIELPARGEVIGDGFGVEGLIFKGGRDGALAGIEALGIAGEGGRMFWLSGTLGCGAAMGGGQKKAEGCGEERNAAAHGNEGKGF